MNFIDGWQVAKNDFNLGRVEQLTADHVGILQLLLDAVEDGAEDASVVGFSQCQFMEDLLTSCHVAQVQAVENL